MIIKFVKELVDKYPKTMIFIVPWISLSFILHIITITIGEGWCTLSVTGNECADLIVFLPLLIVFVMFILLFVWESRK